MRVKFWQTKAFKDLKNEWEEKLKDSGFIDAENNGRLKQNANNSYRTKTLTLIESKLRYYELLGQKFHEEEFFCEVERYVMERRSSGVSIRQIGKELKKQNKKNSVETIRKIIRHYEKLWQIKKST